MATARFKDLCLDVVDSERMARFWSSATGLGVVTYPDGERKLSGSIPQHTIWLNVVPENKTVKHRVHFDVRAASVTEVAAWGATQISADGEFPWTVMADPEGGEFCFFEAETVPEHRLFEIIVDAADPSAASQWWAEVLSGRAVDDDQGFSYVDEIPAVPFDSLVFVPVPEPKVVKNRIHWDVAVEDHDAIEQLVAAGATVLREPTDEDAWTVMADPEGNEFCAFTVVE